MFAPNLRRKIFGWLERLKNSAGIRLSHKKIRRRRGACLKIRRGGWRLRGLGEAIGFRHLLCATLFDTVALEIAINYLCTVSQWMPVSHEISRFNRCVFGLSSWLSIRSSIFSVFSLTSTQNAVCRCPVADQSYPLFRFSLTMCRYFHIFSTCYEPVWQILGLKELMCK